MSRLSSEAPRSELGETLDASVMGSQLASPDSVPASTPGLASISIEVVGTELVFTWPNGSQIRVSLDLLLTAALAAYVGEHPSPGAVTSATVDASGVLWFTFYTGDSVMVNLSTYVDAAIVALQDPDLVSVTNASLAGNVLTLVKSNGTDQTLTLPTLSSLSVSSSSLNATLSESGVKIVDLSPVVQSFLLDAQWLTDAHLNNNNTLTFKTRVGNLISLSLGPSVKKMELSTSNLALTLSDNTIKTVDLSLYVNAAIAAVQDGVTPSVIDANLSNNVITLTKSNMDTIPLPLPPSTPFLSDLTVSTSTLNAILSNTSSQSVDLKPAIQSALSDTQWLSNVALANNTLTFTTHIGSSIPVPLGPAVANAFMFGSILNLVLADGSTQTVDLSPYVDSAIPVAVTDVSLSGNTLILNKSNSASSNVTLPLPSTLSALSVPGNSTLSATLSDGPVKSVDLAPAVLSALSSTQWLSNVSLANNTLTFTTHIGSSIPVPLGSGVTSISMNGSILRFVLATGSAKTVNLASYVNGALYNPMAFVDVTLSANTLTFKKSNSSNSNVTLPSPPSLSALSVSGNSTLSATLSNGLVKSADLTPAVVSALSSTQWLDNVALANNTLTFTTHIGSLVSVPLGPRVQNVIMIGSLLYLFLKDNSSKSVSLSPYVKSAIPVAVTNVTVSDNTLILTKSNSANSNLTLPSPPSLSTVSVSSDSTLTATLSDGLVNSVDLAPAILSALSSTQWLNNVALADNILTFTTHIGSSIPVPLGPAVTDAFMSGSNLSLKLADTSVKTVDLSTYVNSTIPTIVTNVTISGNTLTLNKSNSANSTLTLPLLSTLTVPSGSTLRATLSDGSSVDGNLTPAINNVLDSVIFFNNVTVTQTDIVFSRTGASSFALPLPSPIASASLTNKVLILNTLTGPVSVDLSSFSKPTLQGFASDAAAAAALPVGSMYYNNGTGTVKVVLNYNTPYYVFTQANYSCMYTRVPAGYNTTSWRLEAWIYYVDGTGTSGTKYASILDIRAISNWSFTNYVVFTISQNSIPTIVVPGATAAQMGEFGTKTVPKNTWSHVVWQCSASTGLMTFVNGQLSAQTGYVPPWNTSSTYLCFGCFVNLRTTAFYHFVGRIGQLLLRTGLNVPQYPAAGFTPPPNLAEVATGQSDVLYLMQHKFASLTQPSGSVVVESSA